MFNCSTVLTNSVHGEHMLPEEDPLRWSPLWRISQFHTTLLSLRPRGCLPCSFWSFSVTLGPGWGRCGRQVCGLAPGGCSTDQWCQRRVISAPPPAAPVAPGPRRQPTRPTLGWGLASDLSFGMSAVKAWWGDNRCAAGISQVNTTTVGHQCFQVIPGVN